MIEINFRYRTPMYAMQVTANNMAEVAKWCGGELAGHILNAPENKNIEICSQHGEYLFAHVTDWIVRFGTELTFHYSVFAKDTFDGLFEVVR